MRKLNVLLVDDAPFVRDILRQIFTKGGHTVVGEAENGIEAVDKALKLKPDLIIMDIVMPLKSGVQATIEIKELHPEIRVIACSTLDQENMLLKVMEAGAEAFINKPFDVKQVNDVVAKLFKE